MTVETQTKFKFANNSTIPLKGKMTWGDAQGWESAFDNEFTTVYNSTNAACSVGIDIGANIGVQLTRIRYFPNPTWKIAADYIKGAVIEVSNDNTTWTKLGSADQSVHSGWNSIMVTDPKVYRYVKFSHTSKSGCSIAEL